LNSDNKILKMCLAWGTLVFLSDLFFILFSFSFQNIIINNTLLLIAFSDKKNYSIPITLNGIILITSFFYFNEINIYSAVFIAVPLIITALKGKMGFGDVLLMIFFALNYGTEVFYSVILTVIIIYLSSYKKKDEKIPFAFYFYFGFFFEKIISEVIK